MSMPTPIQPGSTMPAAGSPVTVFPAASAMPAASAPENNRPIQDRRQTRGEVGQSRERRQFGSSHSDLSEAGRELAAAIDEYKLKHHRRYITCDEMLAVMFQLGYAKT